MITMKLFIQRFVVGYAVCLGVLRATEKIAWEIAHIGGSE